MKDWMMDLIKRTYEADEVIDCGDVLVLVKIPETASSETREKIREITRTLLRSRGLVQKREIKLEKLGYE
jgi:hypothetical protein